MRVGNAAGRQSGISRLELAVAIAVFAVLAGVLLERLLYVEEYAEMTAMELTVANMRTGLRNRMGDMLIRDQVSEIATLADENPVNWLENRPESYLGEFDGAPDQDLRGTWYYDRNSHEIVYTANLRRHCAPVGSEDCSTRLRAVALPVPPAGTAEGKRTPQWVALVKTSSGTWF